jgi:hypothetical protein
MNRAFVLPGLLALCSSVRDTLASADAANSRDVRALGGDRLAAGELLSATRNDGRPPYTAPFIALQPSEI